MAQANATLPRNNPSFYIAGGAVTLALHRARQAVKDAIRRKGEKVSAYSAADITTMARAYLAEHRELIVEARATAERWTLEGVFGKRAQRALRAELRSDAQSQSGLKSTTSSVQILGAKRSWDMLGFQQTDRHSMRSRLPWSKLVAPRSTQRKSVAQRLIASSLQRPWLH
jgi:hypothetical protein